MELLVELLKSGTNKLLICAVFIAGTVCAGLLIIYSYINALLFSIDVIKLVLLSISITLPIYLLNVLICLIPYLDKKYRIEIMGEENPLYYTSIIATIINAFIIYMSLICSWLNSYDIYGFVNFTIMLELSLFVTISSTLIEFHLSKTRIKHPKLITNLTTLFLLISTIVITNYFYI